MTNVTLDEIMAELDEVFSDERIQPGDKTSYELAEQYGLKPDAALRRMRELAQRSPDRWRVLKVMNDNSRLVWVLRRLAA